MSREDPGADRDGPSTPKKRKIAIITVVQGEEVYDRYGDWVDTYDHVATSISDWYEVTEEELDILKKASNQYQYKIIERPADEKAFVQRTVANWLIYLANEEKRREKERKEYEAKREADRLKKLEKTKESKLKKLQKMAKDLGVEIQTKGVDNYD